jgi:hypothetical protein
MATHFSLNQRLRPIVAALSLSVAACSFDLGDSTTGKHGAVEFEYTGWTCLFGCAMDQPLLAGTEQTISVKGGRADDPGVVATSTNPSVAAFGVERSCDCERSEGNSTTYMSPDASGACSSGFRLECDNIIEVQALSPGSAGLELRTRDGALIDATTVRIAAAATATLHGEGGMEIGDAVTMNRGDNMLVSARLVDAEGRELLADKGVAWTIEGNAAASGWCLFCSSDELDLRAAEPGSSTVTMRAAGVSTTFVVHVAQ